MKGRAKPCGLHCVKVNHLSVRLGGTDILHDINLHIHCGMLTVIIGKNGSGKSTLIKTLLGEIPYEGEIICKDHKNQILPRLKTGYVPQNINIDKNVPLSVYDFLASFYSNVPVFLKKSKKDYSRIKEQLAAFQADELIDKQIGKLSGGELQRVLLSMATMEETNLLILDEPVSGIDKNGMELFYETIAHLKKNYDLAVVLVSHDLEYVSRYADKVVLLQHEILVQGSPREVYESELFKNTFGYIPYEMREEDGNVVSVDG